MTRVEVRNITAVVEGRDLWRAEEQVGKARVGRAISSAVAAALHEIAAPPTRSFADRVADLHRVGLCDSLIATELHVVKQRVADTRRGIGLTPNPCHRSGRRK